MAYAVISVVAERVAAFIEDRVNLVRGVKKQLLHLSDKLHTIRDVLDDAENRGVKDQSVKNWLKKLEDTAYEMDDILDEWNYALLKHKMPKQKVNCSFIPSSWFCSNKVGVRHDTAIKIQIVKATLDQILKEKDDFNFVISLPAIVPVPKSWRDQSTSSIEFDKVYGRDEDRDNIVRQLMKLDGDAQLVCVVGMGGIGKTTLAQLVYNDTQIEDCFELKIWICVSEPFDMVAIARGIVDSVGIETIPPNTDQLDLVLQKLRDSVSGKKFLLVLDDVWTEEYNKWQPLKINLQYGAPTSKILVTTRNERVAKMMGTLDEDIYHPQQLSDEECWSLMRRISLSGRSEEECGEFEEVGKKIASKCKGLPLAANVLGSLLQFKNSLEEWENILESEIWQLEKAELELFPHLLLSYNELSPSLKRCFSYCAIYPKDYQISVECLIQEWLALGYLGNVTENGGVKLKGREHFNNLAMRCLFQDFHKSDELGEQIEWCKMHDIVHDFAQFLRKNNERGEMRKRSCQLVCDPSLVSDVQVYRSIYWDKGTPPLLCDCLKSLRVLRFNKGLDGPPPRGMEKLIHLRWLDLSGTTLSEEDLKMICRLYFLQTLSLAECSLEEISREIENLVKLRHLDLSANYKLKEIPESVYSLVELQTLSLAFCSVEEIGGEIGNLVHLRNLHLSANELLKELPESMCNLVELQTLDITDCSHLSILPQGIHKLQNLQRLLIDGTLASRRLPQGVGELSGLRTLKLTSFKVGSDCNKLGLLKKLNHLTRDLTLVIQLRRSSDVEELVEDAREAELRNKIHIRRLFITFEDEMDERERSSSSLWMDVIEALEPYHKLYYLEISGYGGSRLPHWMSSPLNLIKEINLYGFSEVCSLPAIGKLPFLEVLSVNGMDELKVVGREFLGIESSSSSSSSTSNDEVVAAFPKLKKLSFWYCHKWEEWDDITAEEEEEEFADVCMMPCLTRLYLNWCEGLKKLPHRLLRKASSLQMLNIRYSSELEKRYGDDKEGSAWRSISQYNPKLQLHLSSETDLDRDNILIVPTINQEKKTTKKNIHSEVTVTMADAIISVVVERVAAIIEDQIRYEVNLVRGVEKELLDLSDKLETIKNVLDDAEKRGVTDQSVKNWLKRLKDTAYEMDDLLDEWNYALLKHKMAKQKVCCSFIPSSCLCFNKVVVRHDTARKIKGVKAILDQILKEKDDFSFVMLLPTTVPVPKSGRDQSTSSIELQKVHGVDIERNKNDIVRKLIRLDADTQIVSIVGMGGIGKTTLAQLVYNNTQVKDCFELTIWICVSDPFDVAAIARGIVECARIETIPPNTNQLELVLEKLRDCISGKKFLLVLDDVWTEDYNKWEPLKINLQYGAPTSKILVTTRNERVAKMMGSLDEDIYRPQQLSDEECWSLMRPISLSGRSEEECREFENVGNKIASKCKGLPLAANVLGSLLQFKNSWEEWENVWKSEIWQLEKAEVELFPHLVLSYNELSPALKHCFSYCAVYPKDCRINIEILIEEWMALGYLGSMIGDIDGVELKGREYFNNLTMRSLFQDFEESESGEQIGVEWCKVHDIVHDFAKFVRKNNDRGEMRKRSCQLVCNPLLVSEVQVYRSIHWDKKIPPLVCDCLKSVRVLRFNRGLQDGPPQGMEKLIHLRWLDLRGTPLFQEDLKIICRLYFLQTLLLAECSLEEIWGEIGNLVKLRHLDLSRNEGLKELPESMCSLLELQTLLLANCSLEAIPADIGNLIKLRHLDLSVNKLLKELPESMCSLFELQILNIVGCRDLNGLPQGIHRLQNLQHLLIESTLASNHGLPQGVGELSGLRTLELGLFRVGIGYNKLGLLKRLNRLTGDLKLKIHLKRSSDPEELVEDAREARLRNKIHIRNLSITFEDEMNEREQASSMWMDVIEALEPNIEKLQQLEIRGYKGSRLPQWMSSPLNLIKQIILSKFSEVCSLPALGKLPFLEVLYMRGLKELKVVGREFMGIDSSSSSSTSNHVVAAFPKLKILEFGSCPKWEEWEDLTAEEEESAVVSLMPCLTELTIYSCMVLKKLPHRLLRKASLSLQILNIWSSSELVKRYGDDQDSPWRSISQYNPHLRLFH
ncbi:uncharacterized protein LOC131009694 [Salvia miltiorrhiza]|uniref:uncharacterized protein LOC131009694 n=1 Tax=Salvia miltiorrhiza TaxID=226208 RepID=UPI0025AC928E|nr:uncharacterized protein LOC131009694 [Salvia miltiorrhiza]